MTAEVCAKQCRVVGPGFHETTTKVPNGNGYFDGCSEVELKQFHTRCIGGSTASAVQLRFGNEPALDSLSKVKVKVKSCWGRGIKAFPCHRCHAATLVGTASDGQTRAPSNSASCLNMPKTACSSLRMTATSATILHLPRSCRAR